MEHSLPSFHMN